ncbi:simple sugar transport system permease protein [Paenibacillus phyllosphaerae]|uniref:Simple sugar transport system permease protein n=1 Tax=Paenibacillus phyllosphaerae TaxID=274593 RepID=A0A7W5B487_9BACL|nr:ABC transporter permease [Paenibacillus phyllosphaerae]MBB3114135.1 simple sugar transport system permease protein [Paenibacillus phyllosphaerae]
MNVIEVLGQLMNTTLVFSTALIFAALGGLLSERSGVVNIGLEGLMTAGAFAAAVGADYAARGGMSGIASAWVGLVTAMIFATVFALLHAVATITFKANQVVVGTVINFLALGFSLYMVKNLYEGAGETATVELFSKFQIPFLSDIPLIGEGLFTAYPTTYLCLILVFVVWYVLFKTPFGLRLRAVGEHPGSADTVGISVKKYRYIGVLLSGVFAGLGGATITLTTTSTFSHNTISGQGFIALAAVIFGKWHPLGAAGAAIFFGFAQSLRNFAQLFEFSQQIPQEFFYMLPYVLTLLVLAAAVGRSRAPGALGEPYDPGKR